MRVLKNFGSVELKTGTSIERPCQKRFANQVTVIVRRCVQEPKAFQSIEMTAVEVIASPCASRWHPHGKRVFLGVSLARKRCLSSSFERAIGYGETGLLQPPSDRQSRRSPLAVWRSRRSKSFDLDREPRTRWGSIHGCRLETRPPDPCSRC